MARRGTKKKAPIAAASAPSRMLAIATVTATFKELDVPVSVCSNGAWSALYNTDNTLLELEGTYGRELERWPYNDRCIDAARARKGPFVGERGGFYDLFVPIELGTLADSFLVTGPLARKRPTGPEIADRWHWLSQTRAELSDPAFVRYFARTLQTLTLEGDRFDAFENLISSLAHLLAGRGDTRTLSDEVAALIAKLLPARSSERMWEAARKMVDERTAHVWTTPLSRDPLQRMGIERAPLHALVGLLQPRERERDPIDDALRLHAFQRATADLAWKRGNLACGQLTDQGVTLLSAHLGGPARIRSLLLDLATKVTALARGFGFRLGVGVAPSSGAELLPACYRAALAAAERALSLGTSLQFAEARPESSARNLARLRARLVESAEGRSNVLLARFERYAEAAALHSGYQLEGVRAHLGAGLDLLAEPLIASGKLDRRSFEELTHALERAPDTKDTVGGLIAAYRGVVADIERTVQRPTSARQSRSRQRAVAFMRENLGKPLTLGQVSRVAGFAPNYFSRLLKREEGVTFERYLQALRIDHAKQTLAGTNLPIGRVAELAGFKSRTYFQKLFRETAGVTPVEYRKREQLA